MDSDTISVLGIIAQTLTALVGIAVTVFLYRMDRRTKKQESDSEEREKQEELRRKLAADEERKASNEQQQRLRRIEDDARWFDLHEAVTRPEIMELRCRVRIDESETQARQAALNRAFQEIRILQEGGSADPPVIDFVTAEVDRAMNAVRSLPGFEDTVKNGEEVSKADFTKYRWGESAKLTKIGALQLVARRYAKERHVRTMADFNSEFSTLLREVFAESRFIGRLDASSLLSPVSQDDRAQRLASDADEIAPELIGALSFDGVDYILDWWVGVRGEEAIGIHLHKPLLDHFAGLGDPVYPVRRA